MPATILVNPTLSITHVSLPATQRVRGLARESGNGAVSDSFISERKQLRLSEVRGPPPFSVPLPLPLPPSAPASGSPFRFRFRLPLSASASASPFRSRFRLPVPLPLPAPPFRFRFRFPLPLPLPAPPSASASGSPFRFRFRFPFTLPAPPSALPLPAPPVRLPLPTALLRLRIPKAAGSVHAGRVSQRICHRWRPPPMGRSELRPPPPGCGCRAKVCREIPHRRDRGIRSHNPWIVRHRRVPGIPIFRS
jgi:hypothetical protein